MIHHLFSKSMVRPEDRALIMCLLERVVGIAKEEPSTQPEFLKALMSGSNGGSVAFDKVTEKARRESNNAVVFLGDFW